MIGVRHEWNKPSSQRLIILCCIEVSVSPMHFRFRRVPCFRPVPPRTPNLQPGPGGRGSLRRVKGNF